MSEKVLLVLGVGLFSFTPLSPFVTLLLLKSGGGKSFLKHLLGRFSFYLLLTVILVLSEVIVSFDLINYIKTLFEGRLANYLVFGVLTLMMIKIFVTSSGKEASHILKPLRLEENAYWSGIVFSAIQPRIILLYLYGFVDLIDKNTLYNPYDFWIVIILFLSIVWHQLIVWLINVSFKINEGCLIKRKQQSIRKNWKIIMILFYVTISCILLL